MFDAVLDTSVFIAIESGRGLDVTRLPPSGSVSVVTVAELQAGVLTAPDSPSRARRLRTLGDTALIERIPVDVDVAERWADLRSHLRDQGARMTVNHLWIAATAVRHQVPLVTQDDDFDALEGFPGFDLLRV